LLFVRESLTQSDKLSEKLIDVSTSLVIGFNQFLELRQKVDSGPVQSHQLVELRANGYLELFKLDILRVRFRKPFRKSFKVDFGKVDATLLLVRCHLSDPKPICGDGVIEQTIYICENPGDIPGSSRTSPSANRIGNGTQARDGRNEIRYCRVWLHSLE